MTPGKQADEQGAAGVSGGCDGQRSGLFGFTLACYFPLRAAHTRLSAGSTRHPLTITIAAVKIAPT